MSMAAIGVAAAGAVVSSGASYGLSQLNKPKTPSLGSGGGGGGSGAPQPIDYGALLGMANAGAGTQSQAILSAFPQYIGAQLGGVDQIASKLNNGYTASALGAINKAMGETGNIDTQAGNSSNVGRFLQGAGMAQVANSGPNALEQNLYNQAGSDLALGSSLNPEEERAASQQASAAWNARGLGTGASAASADLLNRYQYGQQRLAQRQSAATNADNTYTQNPLARFAAGTQALGQANNAFGTSGNLYNQSGNLALNAAGAYIATDPYQRALNPGIAMGQNAFSSLGQTYGQQNQLAGDVASFNANMQASMYNSGQNNQAALAGAQYAGQASNNASLAQLLGSGLSAGSNLGSAYLKNQQYGLGQSAFSNLPTQSAANSALGFTPQMASHI